MYLDNMFKYVVRYLNNISRPLVQSKLNIWQYRSSMRQACGLLASMLISTSKSFKNLPLISTNISFSNFIVILISLYAAITMLWFML